MASRFSCNRIRSLHAMRATPSRASTCESMFKSSAHQCKLNGCTDSRSRKARRRELESGYNHVKEKKRPRARHIAADEWLLTKTKIGYEGRLVYVKQRLGRRLVADIGPDGLFWSVSDKPKFGSCVESAAGVNMARWGRSPDCLHRPGVRSKPCKHVNGLPAAESTGGR